VSQRHFLTDFLLAKCDFRGKTAVLRFWAPLCRTSMERTIYELDLYSLEMTYRMCENELPTGTSRFSKVIVWYTSYIQTDRQTGRQTDRHPRNYISRHFAGGQWWQTIDVKTTVRTTLQPAAEDRTFYTENHRPYVTLVHGARYMYGWQSLSRDRMWSHVTKCTHSWVVDWSGRNLVHHHTHL